MGGENRVVLLDRQEDGEYQIGMPNMYARGILFGKMVLEMGDTSKIRNDTLDLHCDVEFKTKGYFTGTYNAIHGKVTKGHKTSARFRANGPIQWTTKTPPPVKPKSSLTRTKLPWRTKKSSRKTNRKKTNPGGSGAKSQTESRRRNLDKATESKSAIEEKQRTLAKEREESGATWEPRFFVQKGDKYVRGWKVCLATSIG